MPDLFWKILIDRLLIHSPECRLGSRRRCDLCHLHSTLRFPRRFAADSLPHAQRTSSSATTLRGSSERRAAAPSRSACRRADVTAGRARAGRGDARAVARSWCAASSRRCCSAAACTWRCSGCTTAALLAVWLPELEATVDFSQEAGRTPQGRLGAHQAGGAAVGAAAGGALGGAAARHRQGADAHLHARRRRALPPSLGGGRAHVRGRGATLPLRQAGEAEAAVPHPAPPARQSVRRRRGPTRRCAASIASCRRTSIDLLDLSRADITSARPGKRQNALRNISELSARIDEAARGGRRSCRRCRRGSAT